MPKQKAYVILHDGENIAVFMGGTSGQPPEARAGNHLPGGTSKPRETVLQTAKREMFEETGLSPKIITTQTYFAADGLNNVFFVVQWVGRVTDLLKPFRGGPQGQHNSVDSPFTTAKVVPIKECLEDGFFREEHLTEWFAIGVKQAKEENRLKSPSNK